MLANVNYPEDIKHFSLGELKALATEVRDYTIKSVSKTGGHLGAGLGVVELTVALHHVFDTPKDKLIWDVSHQAYPHKILTGRKDKMHTLRQKGGLSGFCKISESEYDAFGAGHSSTSISAALGMALARDRKGEDFEVVAVIGDGSISAGMAYEGLNNAGAEQSKMLVILNDNNMSIAPPTGAMSAYLSNLISGQAYSGFKNFAKRGLEYLPDYFQRVAKKTEKIAKEIAVGGNFFEELGFEYVGPIDGHNLEHLLPVLRNIKKSRQKKPYLLHIVTEKGYGFGSPEQSDEKFHAVKKFDETTKIQVKSKSKPSFTDVFSQTLIAEAHLEKADNKTEIMAITAAMPSGTGLDSFAGVFPEQYFDVGIAEQHAVTMAAGMAIEGLKPFCAIYSTFLQRAYDQLIHDVAIQNLPVRFAIDRAGLVGHDGATHAGSFDIAYLACIPNMVLMAASDEYELANMVKTAAAYSDSPIAFRYPRGEIASHESIDAIIAQAKPIEIGKARIISRSKGEKCDIAIFSYGYCLVDVKQAIAELQESDIEYKDKKPNIDIIDARFAKPIDEDLVREYIDKASFILTIEEGSIGGFGSIIQNFVNDDIIVRKHQQSQATSCRVKSIFLPDRYIDHQSQSQMKEEAQIDVTSIKRIIKELLHVL